MMHRRISLLLFLATSAFAGYTTPNTGVQWNLDSLVVNSAGTLTGTFPSYTLNDTISIAANDRVTIPPGSIITVTQGAGKGFTVFGVLRAIGTATDSIIVKGSVDSAGWHRGFRFDDSSVDSLCTISYCRIMNAVDGVYCFNANTTITNSLFTRNSTNGVRCYGASPVIRNCLFTFNRQAAITANVNSSPLIENNRFSYNNYQNTSAYNAIAVGGQGANNPIIRGNEIFNQNYYRGGAIGLSTLTGTDVCNALIENNYLHDNGWGIATTAFSAGGTIRPMIRYNRIENNRINPNPQVSGSGITMYYGGASNAPIITGNLITGNYWGVTVIAQTGMINSPQPNLGNLSNADTSDDGWNVFENNTNGGNIYQLYNNATQNISAENNYWSTDDSAVVESWIYHRPDSAAFGFVDYMPMGHKGLGRADSFTVRQISQTQLMLRWGFPYRSYQARVNLHYSTNGGAVWSVLASLPDSVTSYTMTLPVTSAIWFRLSSLTRFGSGPDTTIVFPGTQDVHAHAVPPAQFILEQNYPNPFNPSTTIRYQLPRAGHVTLQIFDVLGNEVATLVNEVQDPGTSASFGEPFTSVRFDASTLASGVYFYRLSVRTLSGQAGEFTATRKLLIVR
jgi:hypothetical protein